MKRQIYTDTLLLKSTFKIEADRKEEFEKRRSKYGFQDPPLFEFKESYRTVVNTRCSINQYSNMTLRLTTTLLYLVLSVLYQVVMGITCQKSLKKFAILLKKPQVHVKILINRTWALVSQFLTWSALSSTLMQLGFEVQINWTLFNDPLAAAKCNGVRPSVSLRTYNWAF